MRAVIQRVTQASIMINGGAPKTMAHGLVVLLGIAHADTPEDAEWLAAKIVNMRIMADDEGKMNRSVLDTRGNVMVVSQFTLHASTKKGNRPSFIEAARPEQAIPLYQHFVREMETLLAQPLVTGEFGADMQITLTNDGPVTIIIDSQQKH